MTAVGAQDPLPLANAKAIDSEIQKLPNLPDTRRDAAFQEMLQRIRRQPIQYRLTLASNLAVSAGEVATESATLQKVADLVVEELGTNPGSRAELALRSLAEFASYRRIHVSLEAPGYLAELRRIHEQASTRANGDFTLTDTNGKPWHLKDLRGKVVLVNFWATWCLPCQREMADFQTAYSRFADKGLLILGVTGEDVFTIRRYLADHPINYSVLLDPDDVTKKDFLVNGIPHSLLYNREGKMVAQVVSPLKKQQLLDALEQAGIN